MGKKIDLTGQRFGKLTVIRGDPERDKKGNVKWICRCDCGNTVSVAGCLLRYGNTRSCGCLSLRYEDLTGKRFGKLTVIREDPERSNQGNVKWICRCDCGNTVSVIGTSLTRGNTKSCGCLRSEKAGKGKRNRKSIERRIAELEAKESELKAQKKQLKARLSAEARKARTKQLIQEGAIMEAAIGREVTSEELPMLKSFFEQNRAEILKWLKK